MRSFLISLVCGALCATSVAGQNVLCTLESGGQGFISPVILFTLPRAEARSASVYDSVIDAVHGAPIAARVKSRGKDVLRYEWRVNGIPARPTKASVGYWADLNIKKNTVRISGSIRGFDNDIKGKGRCEQREN